MKTKTTKFLVVFLFCILISDRGCADFENNHVKIKLRCKAKGVICGKC